MKSYEKHARAALAAIRHLDQDMMPTVFDQHAARVIGHIEALVNELELATMWIRFECQDRRCGACRDCTRVGCPTKEEVET